MAANGRVDVPPDPEELSALRWPHPNPYKKLPDWLLVHCMAWYNLTPEDCDPDLWDDPMEKEQARRARIQYVRVDGKFWCGPPHGCGNRWTSYLTWVRFDLKEQTVSLLGQRCVECECRNCKTKRNTPIFHKPQRFGYQLWKHACLLAIEYAIHRLETYIKEEELERLAVERARKEARLPDSELQQLEEDDDDGPHRRELCERCHRRGNKKCRTGGGSNNHCGECARLGLSAREACYHQQDGRGNRGRRRRDRREDVREE